MRLHYVVFILAAFFISTSVRAESTPSEKPVARVLTTQIYPGELEPDAKTLEGLKKSVPEEKLPGALAEYRRSKLNELIWQPLRKQFIKELDIRVSNEDLDDFAEAMMAHSQEVRIAYERNIKVWQDELKQEGLPAAKKAELERRIKGLTNFLSEGKEKQLETYRRIGKPIVEAWKVNREMYDAFGGEVLFQQSGSEPFGAYREFLQREEKSGNFEIYQKELKDLFWRYYSRKQSFTIPKDKVDFATPWWLAGKAKEQRANSEK